MNPNSDPPVPPLPSVNVQVEGGDHNDNRPTKKNRTDDIPISISISNDDNVGQQPPPANYYHAAAASASASGAAEMAGADNVAAAKPTGFVLANILPADVGADNFMAQVDESDETRQLATKAGFTGHVKLIPHKITEKTVDSTDISFFSHNIEFKNEVSGVVTSFNKRIWERCGDTHFMKALDHAFNNNHAKRGHLDLGVLVPDEYKRAANIANFPEDEVALIVRRGIGGEVMMEEEEEIDVEEEEEEIMGKSSNKVSSSPTKEEYIDPTKPRINSTIRITYGEHTGLIGTIVTIKRGGWCTLSNVTGGVDVGIVRMSAMELIQHNDDGGGGSGGGGSPFKRGKGSSSSSSGGGGKRSPRKREVKGQRQNRVDTRLLHLRQGIFSSSIQDFCFKTGIEVDTICTVDIVEQRLQAGRAGFNCFGGEPELMIVNTDTNRHGETVQRRLVYLPGREGSGSQRGGNGWYSKLHEAYEKAKIIQNDLLREAVNELIQIRNLSHNKFQLQWASHKDLSCYGRAPFWKWVTGTTKNMDYDRCKGLIKYLHREVTDDDYSTSERLAGLMFCIYGKQAVGDFPSVSEIDGLLSVTFIVEHREHDDDDDENTTLALAFDRQAAPDDVSVESDDAGVAAYSVVQPNTIIIAKAQALKNVDGSRVFEGADDEDLIVVRFDGIKEDVIALKGSKDSKGKPEEWLICVNEDEDMTLSQAVENNIFVITSPGSDAEPVFYDEMVEDLDHLEQLLGVLQGTSEGAESLQGTSEGAELLGGTSEGAELLGETSEGAKSFTEV